MWAAIREAAPGLVVIDTGPKAMGGETNDGGAVLMMICSSEVLAIHSSRARLRLTHLYLADQSNHFRTVEPSALEIPPGDVVLMWF